MSTSEVAASETAGHDLSAALFSRSGFPPIKDLVPTSLQHVLASFAGVITPAMMIAVTCGFTPDQETAIIQVALILSGIDILLQQFPLFGRIGAGLPILTGVSFAFLPAFQAVGLQFNFPTLLGAELVGGVVAILFGMFYSKVKWLFPPLVTGTVIFTIGVSLYPTAIRYMAGGAGSANFGSINNWIVGLLTFSVVFFLANFGKGVLKLGSIFFGIIAGVIISIPFGMVDVSEVLSSSWFSFPRFMPYEIIFNPAACITLGVVYVMVNVQLIGDLSAATAGSMDRMPNEREIGGAIKAQGVVSIISSFFGGLPTSAFGQNVGIIVSNRVINRWVFGGAAFVFLAAGLCPKLSATLLMIPQPVIGGATISVFGTITLNGIRILVKDGLTPRACTVFGISVAFGLGIAQVAGSLTGPGMPAWVNTIFGTSAITPCAIMAIILNSVLPPENKEMPDEKNLRPLAYNDMEDGEVR
ncbi:solute carrier family 23 protein [Lancefieldella rimae]|uniref:uracil-xanthine permease family protein n=1 Tax=Lancefieldella rimae TaxID=1383 RepID=UPI0028E6795A|nr:solute carrier family 23 protein [Lancefieldella rimae]